MNQVIFDELDSRHIPYRLNEEIVSVKDHLVTFKSGIQEDFDIIIEGVGTHPNSKFIESSNVALDDKGFVKVNYKFETNIPNIYALGDVITSTYRHHVNLPAQVPLAWGSTSCASVIAEQLAGNKNIILKVFGYQYR